MKNRATSYTSASGELPIKVLLNEKLLQSLLYRSEVIPVHVQLNPTNSCNLECDWCSCINRDRKKVLSYDEIMKAMEQYYELGCRAVTITGGGEPLLHPSINKIISGFHIAKIRMGLVTNGTQTHQLQEENWKVLDWVRISLGDGRTATKKFWEDLAMLPGDPDYSFSYVLTNNPDLDLIIRMIQFANRHDYTHVRMTTDIVQRDVETMNYVRSAIHDKIDDRKVIYQDRTQWTLGTPKCYISLLKPVIGADGHIYPCCGAQYFDPVPARTYRGSMGTIEQDIEDIHAGQKYYDGSKCMVCYYSHYNKLLATLLEDVEHQEFV